MEFLVYLIIFIVGSIIVAAMNSSSESTQTDPLEPSRVLARKFAALGDMTGMHKDSITRIVGQPHSWSQIGNDTLIQWILPGYHISILFDSKGNFKTVNSETYTA